MHHECDDYIILRNTESKRRINTGVIVTKRYSVILFITITSVVLGGFLLTGKVIKSNYYDVVSKINNNAGVRYSVVEYNRGLFTSTAQVELELLAENGKVEDKIGLQQRITHGPLLFGSMPGSWWPFRLGVARVRTVLAPELQAKLDEDPRNKRDVTVVTYIDFRGRATTKFAVAPYTRVDESDHGIECGKIYGYLQHDLDLNDIRGHLDIPFLSVNSGRGELVFKDLVVEVSSDDNANGHGGEFLLQARLINFVRNNIDLLRIESLRANLTGNNVDGVFNVESGIKIGRAAIIDRLFEDQSINFKANNLNLEMLANVSSLAAMPRGLYGFAQRLTSTSNDVVLELPREFTSSFLSYLSFELYRDSLMGRHDQRPEALVYQDISKSIDALIKTVLKQRLFVERGDYYQLNFNEQA